MGTMPSCRYWFALILLPCLLAGCTGWGKAEQPVAPRPKGTMSDLSGFTRMHSSAAVEGTIGSVAYLQGDRLMRVRGYGLVVGLHGRGSRSSVPTVRDYLIREIRRARLANPHAEYTKSPEELVDDPSSAVVEVMGEIPAGACKGRTFDVYVSATSFDPDTESIAGGYLLLCDLKMYREVSPQEIIEGRTLARACGPIFTNPFVSGERSAAGTNPREGRVLAGGVVLQDRELSLVTVHESYATVRQIQNAINQTFICKPPAATGLTQTTVKLCVPPEYRGRERRFLELVMHLSLTQSAAAKEARTRQLIAEMVRPDAPLDDLALSLEGVGQNAVKQLQELYTHHRREVNYHAARTGLRLGDSLALEVVARHAKDEKSPFRGPAIRELGEANLSQAVRESGGRGMAVRASAVLRELLADADPRVRILAYESLRKVDPDGITTRIVGRDPENFILDVVPSDGPMLIYARRAGTRRVALIGGERMIVQPPFLYSEKGKPIVISAVLEDKFISLIKKDHKGSTIFGPVRVLPSLPHFTHFLGNDPETDIHGQLQGLGLDYSVVLDVLYRLCEKKSVAADFRWEEPGIEDLIGPLKPPGRPESEL